MEVQFVDLNQAFNRSDNDILNSIKNVIESRNFILGEKVTEFEKAFSAYTHTPHCAALSNGLDALTIALLAADIGENDEVLVSSNTFIATWLSIKKIGAKPIPVESCPITQNLDIRKIDQALTKRTKAIVPVHIYGTLCDMKSIQQFAKANNLIVIEDAAQAHGATRDGYSAGHLSDAAAFSFYPTKNLGAYGDAGAVISRSSTYIERIKLIRNYGSSEKYIHTAVGGNYRMDEIQAAVLIEKLKLLSENNMSRSVIANYYSENIKNSAIQLPHNGDDSFPSWHLYTIRVKKRDKVIEHFKNKNIQFGIHYPIPPHLQECFYKDYPGLSLKVTEEISETTLSLPLYPNMPLSQAEYVVDALNDLNL